MRNPVILGGSALALAIIALVVAIIALTTGASQAPAATADPQPAAEATATKANPTDYTVYLVNEAIAYYEANGREATVAYYNSPESVDGSWYVYIFDENNVRIAHPTVPAVLGVNVDHPMSVDINGYDFGKVMAATDENGHWVDYVFLNPDTGLEQSKHSWLIRHEGLVFGSGWYEGSPVRATDKSNPIDYTVSLVNQALHRYQLDGREATLEYYNSPANVDGEWYVFVIDEQGRVAAHSNSALLGEDLTGPLGVDLTGYRFGEVMAATDEKGQWVDYVFTNPDTGLQESKHSWLIKRDGLIFGSGWYQDSPVRPVAKSNPIDYTVSLVNQATDRLDRAGREATLKYYNSPESVDGDWFVFIIDEQGELVAHADQSRLGGDVADGAGTDIFGYQFRKVMLAIEEGEGRWVDYFITRPETGKPAFKQSWVVRHQGLLFGSGWYQTVPLELAGGGAVQAAGKSNPIDYTVSLVNQATDRLDREGRDATLAYYNSPASVDGEWYVFISDEQGKLVAHANPALLGESWAGPLGVDLTGYRFGEVIVATDEKGQWVDYVFTNPDTGLQQSKHSWLIKRDGLIFGAGWYQGSPVQAAGKSNPIDYTVSLVNQALSRYQADGRAATLDYYNSPESVDGEWYVYVIDEQGKLAAHPNQSLLGEDLTGPLGVDITGYAHGKVMAATDEKGQWVDYVFLNPDTGFEQSKHSWLIKHDGLIFGAGWYEGSPVKAADKSNPIDYTVSVVNQALRRYELEGREATLEYYNSPESVDGNWYVFIYDENNIRIAHPTRPDLLGKPVDGPTGVDITGYAYGKAMAQTTEAGQWVDYVFLNPGTGFQQSKHSWLVKHDGLIFGSGWYQGSPVRAAEKSNPIEYTVSLVRQATSRFDREGREATLDYYNSPESVDGDWYIFIIDEEGKVAAHPAQSELGGDLAGESGTDVFGQQFGKVMLAIEEGEGEWVDYFTVRPGSGTQAFKQSWVVRHQGLLFGAGWYQTVPLELVGGGADKATDPAGYTVTFLEKALSYYDDNGKAATVAYYNTPESMDDSWYVFIFEADGVLLASAPNQELLGQSLDSDLGVDVTGKRFGAEILNATSDGRWVDYTFNNPGTGEPGVKHSWVIEYQGLIFGSGWYE